VVGVRLPETPSGRNVAVVGGGPAGLACAIRLLEKGHAVTLFEKSDRLGGTPDCIIPGARYQHASEEADAILAPAKEAARIEIKFGQSLGQDFTLEDLQERHDAVFLGFGLGKSTSLGDAEGVLDALTFLKQAKAGLITSLPARVAVLGGGNTAMDSAATATKLAAYDVYVVYRRSFAEMPAWPNERDQVLQLGCHLLILTQPLGYQTDDAGKLTGLRVARTQLGPPDDSGRRTPQVVPGTESVMPVDMVIEAIGQRIPDDLQPSLADLALTNRGLVATQPGSQATSMPGVFAGGDLVNGGTTAVQGIAEGMHAAEEIDDHLTLPAQPAKSKPEA
jgi:NADPH-dependent glutamate synthase beta subunit-like oxidoreductase